MSKSIVPAPTSQRRFPITPEAFWTKFSETLRDRWFAEADIDAKYENDGFWTPFMTDLLKEIGKAFDCYVDCEYWPRVDVSYFCQDRCCKDWDEWSREVAIEHEARDTWTDELCKLIEINAGLKVLIAYPRRNEIDAVLNRLPAVYQSRKYVTSPCKYLFIFGPGCDLDDFTAYTFDGKTVTEITGDTKIITSGAHQKVT